MNVRYTTSVASKKIVYFAQNFITFLSDCTPTLRLTRRGFFHCPISLIEMTVAAPALHDITVVKVKTRIAAGAKRFNVARNGALKLGNPHKIESEADRDQVVEAFRKTLWAWMNQDSPYRKSMVELLEAARKGPIELSCHCAPKRCHAHVIKSALEWMNEHPHFA